MTPEMDMTLPEQAPAVRLHRRVLLCGAVLTVALGSLVLRLWQVQVCQGDEHGRAIVRQSIRPIRLNAVRGRIMASDGTVLVDNRAQYDVVFHVSEMRQPGPRSRTVSYILDCARNLSAHVDRDCELTQAALERHLHVRPALPLAALSGLTPGELARVSEMMPPIPGMQVVPRTVREYPFPGFATHVLGFTGRQRPREPDPALGEYLRAYVSPELHGRGGLELRFDSVLAGQAGVELVRVNTLGYVHEVVGSPRPPRNGKDLLLTLDMKAQTVAEDLLSSSGHPGAIVLLDVRDGAVLAMASSPSYDVSQLTASRYAELAGDERRKPLVNRALTFGYTPGSIVKPLVALAALEAGVVTPRERIVCTGAFTIGNARIRCWRRSGHGPLVLQDALTYSCNPFLITIGMRAGLDNLRPVFKAAGLGEAPGIELPGCGAGLIPSREYAREHWGRDWIAIDTAYVSMGQGAIAVTPLQAAMYTAALANGGTIYRPHIVASVRHRNGRVWRKTAPVVEHRLPVLPEHLDLVRAGMIGAVTEPGGTAARAANPAISLAAKTGTAEVGLGSDRHKNVWVICYGPVEEPRYAFACMLEYGDSGGRTAAPVAGHFFRRWLEAD